MIMHFIVSLILMTIVILFKPSWGDIDAQTSQRQCQRLAFRFWTIRIKLQQHRDCTDACKDDFRKAGSRAGNGCVRPRKMVELRAGFKSFFFEPCLVQCALCMTSSEDEMFMELDRTFNPWEKQLGNPFFDREPSHCGCGLQNPCECAASKIYPTVCRCKIQLVLQTVLMTDKGGLAHDGVKDPFFCNPRAIVERLLVLLDSDWSYDDTYYQYGPVACTIRRSRQSSILSSLCICSCNVPNLAFKTASVSCEEIHAEIETLPPRSLLFDYPGLAYLNGLTRMQFDHQYKLYLYFWTPRTCDLFDPSLFEEFSDVDRFERFKLNIETRHIKAMQPNHRGKLADASSLHRKKQKQKDASSSNAVSSLLPINAVLAPLEDFQQNTELDPSVDDWTQFEVLNTDFTFRQPAAPVATDREFSSGHQELSPVFDIGVLDEIINYEPAAQVHTHLPSYSAHDPQSTEPGSRHAAQDVQSDGGMSTRYGQLQLQSGDMMQHAGSLSVDMPLTAADGHASDPATAYFSQEDFLFGYPQYAASFNRRDDESDQANLASVLGSDQDGADYPDSAFFEGIP